MGAAADDLRAAYAGVPHPLENAPEAEGLVLDPARPDFKRRMPRPWDDGLQPISGRASIERQAIDATANGDIRVPHSSAMTVPSSVGAQRLLLSWAREPGVVLVGIEQAPEWEVVGGMLPVPEAHLQSLLPVFAALGVPLKDLREVSHGPPLRSAPPAPPGTTGTGSTDEPPHWAPSGDAVPQRRRPRPPGRGRLAATRADDRPRDGTDSPEPVDGP